jgi:hypothetical protein
MRTPFSILARVEFKETPSFSKRTEIQMIESYCISVLFSYCSSTLLDRVCGVVVRLPLPLVALPSTRSGHNST